MSEVECGVWLYFKLFISKRGGKPQDFLRLENCAERFLSDYALPTLAAMRQDSCCSKYFFIRYAEGGYHLRLRCFCRDNASLQVARRRIHGAIDRFLADHPGMIEDANDTTCLLNDGRLLEDRYEPELEKYCGPQGMLVAENHFEHCTRLIAEAMSLATGGLRKDHIALWLLGQALAAADLSPCEIAAVLSGHSRYWWPAFGRDHESVRNILERNYCEKKRFFSGFLPDADLMTEYAKSYPMMETRLGRVRDLYRETISSYSLLEDSGILASDLGQQLRADVAAAEGMPSLSRYPLTYLQILPNLVHMMNNRLGIDIVKESQLAYFAGRSFGDRCERPATTFEIVLEPSLRSRDKTAVL